MRFCQSHWDQLRKLIEDKGMGHLIPKDGEEATARMASGQFDPLMGTHNTIITKVIQVFGIAALATDENWCPMCHIVEAIKACKCGKVHTEEEGRELVVKWFEGALAFCKKEADDKDEAAGGSSAIN